MGAHDIHHQNHTAMLIWTEKFSTGSPVIDEQHRQLIHHLNQFEGLLLETNPTAENIATIIRFLEFVEDYADSHFRYEEQCMESYRCPVHIKNLQAHQHFKDLFTRFKARVQKEGFRVEMLAELSQTLKTWIQDHILRVDMELKPCLARSGQ